MKSISTNIYLALLLFIIIPTKSFCTVYTTKANGSFTSAATWITMPPAPPATIGVNDTIIIKHNVTITANYNLTGTMIINTGASFSSTTTVFSIDDNADLIVNGFMKMYKYNNDGTFTVNGRVEAVDRIVNNSADLGMNGNGGIIRVGIKVVNNSGGKIGGYINFCQFDEVTNPMQNITGTIEPTVTYCGGTLPIDLTFFNAVSETKGIKIEWITSKVHENSSFDIEKSYNGNKFKKIASINSTEENSYTYLDENEKNTLVYYRLKTVNSSGLTETSNIISLNQQATNTIEIFPNPCRKQDQMSIKINNSINGNCSILITNSQGGVIYKNQFISNDISLPEFSLTPGIYFIQVASDSEKVTEKFIIE